MSARRSFTARFLALLLSAALALPWAGPAYALRASSESAHAGLEEALLDRAGLEEITTVDQLLARFPRLLGPGPRAYANNQLQNKKQLRGYHQQFFSRPDVQAAQVDPAFVASLLRELEDAEADVARLLPRFPQPPVAFIDLDCREGGNWAEIRDSGLRINVAHGQAWQAVAPFILRHELGERILDEEPEYRLAVMTAVAVDFIRRDHVLTGWPGHPFLNIPAWPRARPRPSPIPWLLAPLYGARVWDVVADRVALLLTDGRPDKGKKVVNGMHAFLQQHHSGVARQAYELVVGDSPRQHPSAVASGLGTLAVAVVIAEVGRAHEDAAALNQAALHIADVLDHDPDVAPEDTTWSAAYAAVTDYYRTIARDLQLRVPAAGLEEKIAAARQVVSDVLAPIGQQDLSQRVQVLAPSVVRRHRALAGFIGQHGAIVVIPPSELQSLATDEAVADALVRQTPSWTARVYVYGTAAEVSAFHAALGRQNRRVAVEPVLWETSRPDVLDTLTMILTHLEVPAAHYEDKLQPLWDSLATLAQQY